MPMTPGAISEFGSDHDSPYCSPRPVQHAEPVYMTGSTPLPTEKTHTTSGVRKNCAWFVGYRLTLRSVDEHRTEQHSAPSAKGRRNMPVISKSSSQQ